MSTYVRPAVSDYRCVKTLPNRAMLLHKPIVTPLQVSWKLTHASHTISQFSRKFTRTMYDFRSV